MENNPILFVDPKGDIIKVTGPKSADFLKSLNAASDVKFKYNENSQLVLVNPDAEIVGEFMTQMVSAMNNDQTVELKTINTDKNLYVDSYVLGTVDVEDLENLGSPDLFKIQLIHFVVERFEITDYEKNKTTSSNAEFDAAHVKGAESEAAIMKELYPDLKNIQYTGEGWDKSTLKINEDGKTGTMEYIFHFGDLDKVITQPVTILEDGSVKTTEDVVKGELRKVEK